MTLSLRKLSKRSGDKWILRDVEFNAEKGRILGILAPSASGKTTLLKLLAGIEKPNGGEVLLDGSATFTSEYLSPESVRPRSTWFKRRDELSSTELQLNKLRSALEKGVDLLLIDELFPSADPDTRERFEQLLRTAAERSVVVIASADMRSLVSIADEIVVLDRGYVVETGSPTELYRSPKTVAAASLTGSNNFFKARRLSSSDAELPIYQTMDGSHQIKAARVVKRQLAPINQNSTLSIRPENVSISMGASFPEDNLLKAKVSSIKFAGDSSLVTFDCDGLTLTSRVSRVVGLDVGDECMLSLPPDHIHILK